MFYSCILYCLLYFCFSPTHNLLLISRIFPPDSFEFSNHKINNQPTMSRIPDIVLERVRPVSSCRKRNSYVVAKDVEDITRQTVRYADLPATTRSGTTLKIDECTRNLTLFLKLEDPNRHTDTINRLNEFFAENNLSPRASFARRYRDESTMGNITYYKGDAPCDCYVCEPSSPKHTRPNAPVNAPEESSPIDQPSRARCSSPGDRKVKVIDKQLSITVPILYSPLTKPADSDEDEPEATPPPATKTIHAMLTKREVKEHLVIITPRAPRHRFPKWANATPSHVRVRQPELLFHQRPYSDYQPPAYKITRRTLPRSSRNPAEFY